MLTECTHARTNPQSRTIMATYLGKAPHSSHETVRGAHPFTHKVWVCPYIRPAQTVFRCSKNAWEVFHRYRQPSRVSSAATNEVAPCCFEWVPSGGLTGGAGPSYFENERRHRQTGRPPRTNLLRDMRKGNVREKDRMDNGRGTRYATGRQQPTQWCPPFYRPHVPRQLPTTQFYGSFLDNTFAILSFDRFRCMIHSTGDPICLCL